MWNGILLYGNSNYVIYIYTTVLYNNNYIIYHIYVPYTTIQRVHHIPECGKTALYILLVFVIIQ